MTKRRRSRESENPEKTWILSQAENDKSIAIEGWLKENISKLKSAGIESARLDCLLLLEHILKRSRVWILAHNDAKLSQSHLLELNTKVIQRISRTPLAYISKTQEFYGRKFYVDENVLIPRPESEAIIELLKELYTNNSINTVIDIGTGSGILAITAKLELKDVHVTATDVSNWVLKIAKKNARDLKANIRFTQSDLLDNLPQMPKTRPYVILANLPYVPKNLITSDEITKEPPIALFSGQDGLNHYRRFWQEIKKSKNQPQAIIIESLKTQHKHLIKLAEDSGYRLGKTLDLAQLFIKIE